MGGVEFTHEELAERTGIIVPAARTLAKYGLNRAQWLELLAAQDWQCPICERRVTTWNTDHEHVRGWKNMEADERRRYVRGVLCIRCNWKVVTGQLSAKTAGNIYRYLLAYEARRDA